jgi:hypothetical protein
MGARAALAAGTGVSAAVTAAWSWLASLTAGPAASVHLGRDLPAGYARLAAAPTGNGPELFAAVAVICALCLLASGWRQHRRERTGNGGGG